MGKPGKLLRTLIAGVRGSKSPSKERPGKRDKDYVKKKGKDKCFGSLGKSSSCNRGVAVTGKSASPEAIEIKCVQVDSEKLKAVKHIPVGDPLVAEPHAENKVPNKHEDGVISPSDHQVELNFTREKESNNTLVHEHAAASKIQAAFRCYLAQRAFRALRALVRLQALVRGRIVRRQASESLRCMNALIRVQALVRGHHVRNSELGELVQKHLQQTKMMPKKKLSDGWAGSMAITQQLHSKKQDALSKKQRALVIALLEQLNRDTHKQSTLSGYEDLVDKSNWIWVWLERWTLATSHAYPVTITVEDCGCVAQDTGRAKSNLNGVRQEVGPRKERRKWGEHPNGFSIVSQREHASQWHDGEVVHLSNEEIKIVPELERIGTFESNVSGGNLIFEDVAQRATSAAAQNSVHFSSLEGIPSWNEEQSSTIEKHNIVECTLIDSESKLNVVTEPISETSEFPSMTCLRTPDAKATSSQSSSQASPNPIATTVDQHSAYATTDISQSGPNAQSEEPKSNYSSVFSFSPTHGACSPSETFSPAHPVKDANAFGTSVVHPASCKLESGCDTSSNVVFSNEEMIKDDKDGYCEHLMANINRENGQEHISHIREDTGYCTNMHVTMMESESEIVVIPSRECDDEDFIECDASSEVNGGQNIPTNSASACSNNGVANKSTILGPKHEQMESTSSASLPSYMSTTLSSKAKMRTTGGPKQRSDSPKLKSELSKTKVDSSKAKAESPTTSTASTQRPDSASKRRHSLSAFDGKVVSPVGSTQKPTVHVRAGSKGNFSSMRDLSCDNISLSNGESRRHGK
ncbi:hypothetical protein KP509_04G041100 [Ceratopteris richardii]|uniref:DUF4005 domain-containing protein n=1 Tax=Ceratopteris richardii TaxID=49495 RepID=A0A8T2USA6_CERRI|nr:hypothetical protein KP509_04G041100 [Ceratopteris richardii]KAH7439007.1 hypothetical protein KP509_04G041100 [Ceratopteris richardii]KAH7439008.1 hypothetical protein KP509_04G041100 [Ceratopteris richardii]KAH7439009.1 hypothetical protein KP509_04G041100 [Ceratopteris richardii]KAH7439010.1 hypothetical protein KP509_04G041100 [Ceratopteris richardii]